MPADPGGAPLSADELAKIRTRVEAATPGPWRSTGHVLDPVYKANVWATDRPVGGTDLAADADFIAHAREDIERLLAQAERTAALREAIERHCAAFEASDKPGMALVVGDLRKALAEPAP